jgi:hypothetical protein
MDHMIITNLILNNMMSALVPNLYVLDINKYLNLEN